MEELSCNNGKVYIFNGHVFLRNRVKNNTQYFKCRNKWCTSRVVMKADGADEPPIQLRHNHNHLADAAEVEKLRFRQELNLLAETSPNNVKDVFNQTSER